MEEMIVSDPLLLENSEVEQSNDAQSSESLVPNVTSDVVSTDDVSMAPMDGSNENIPNDGTEDCSGANLDQVSSSTESFSGSCRDVLPTVNHQMGVIPNMEPYLEDGSLDGSSKELQDPTSTNGNLTIEDTSNSDPTSNNIDSAESVIEIQENADRQLNANLNSDSPEEGINSDTIDTTIKNGSATEEEQVASCSNQLIEESTSAICNDVAAITETEEYRNISQPFTCEGSIPANPSANQELEVSEPVDGEAVTAGQLQDLSESNKDNFAAEVYPESDVSSLTQTELVQQEEPVSNSLADHTTTEEAPNEIAHEESASSDPSCQRSEASDERTTVMESDYVDSSTLHMEDQEFVTTEPDASLMDQEGLHGMPIADQETSESFASVEPGQIGVATESVPEIDAVDSSVDHITQRVDHTPDTRVADGSFHEELIEADPVIDSRDSVDDDAGLMHRSEIISASQVDSGALECDLVQSGSDDGSMEADQLDSRVVEGDIIDCGTAESGMVDETAMETDHVDSRTLENEPTAEEAMEPTEGITLDNPNDDQVVYGDPLESSTVESESIEPQHVDAQPMDTHLIETQPAEGANSSYYMGQPDGTVAEEAEAASNIENPLPTPSHMDSNFQCSEVENSDLVTMETAISNPTAVCEADSSVAGMEDSSYEVQHIVDTQNVYVVDDGHLTLNSVQPSNSMASYHNADNTMLVEMAPLSTDGSYVNSQVSYVDAGQEGMITDAQAAELLMRVSEQRPISLQSLQQDSASSSGPYVQVQLAQTVEGITHLVEVPVSALAGYCLPSTLVYSTSGGGNSSSVGSEMTTWVQMHETSSEQHHMRPENKFADIVSASIEAIGFPESSTPGANILSQAEQILIASENAAQESAAATTSNNFEFDDNSNSSLTLMNEKPTTSYPRPKRESIESRIHRLLRGANAPVPEIIEEPPMQMPGKASPKNIKLTPLQPAKAAGPSPNSSSATVTLSLSPNQPKRATRLVTATTSTGRTVTIPTVFTATNLQSANKSPSNTLPPGSVDYFMPRGVSKRKAQTFKASKINALNPNSIDVEPAPPEETQVKLAMGSDMLDEDDLHKDDDEFNRAVLLQARQRLQSEQGPRMAARSSSVHLSLSIGSVKTEEEEMTPAKRVRLSFPPEKYANLESISPSYMAELQTPKLTYTIPRTRQVRPKVNKEVLGIDNQVKAEKEISVRLPWMDDDDELKHKRTPPRIIRQVITTESKSKEVDVSAYDLDPDAEQSDQVIVIGLDETGQQPSEEQLTAIIQAAMTKRESSVPEKPSPSQATRALTAIPATGSIVTKVYSAKRKVEDENGVDAEENGVRPKVIRTYDRGLGIPRKRPPRSKKLSTYLEIFDFEEEEDEEEEDEVDDLERFSQALAEEEKAVREKETLVQTKKQSMSATNNSPASTAIYSRGRGGGRGRGRAASHSNLRQTPEAPGTSPTVRVGRPRGRPPRGNKTPSRSKTNNSRVTKGASSDDDYIGYEDDANDDDYKPAPRGRGRGRGRGRSRGRRGRPRTVSKEEPVEEDEGEEDDDDEDEARIPGMPSKPCPQCEERFTTREGFLDHIIVHSSAKCLLEECDWTNPVPKDKSRLKQHMLNSHTESIPTARTTAAR